MPRRVRSRKRKIRQGLVQKLGIEAIRDRDEWSRIVNDWHGRCAYCGRKPTKNEGLTRDHVIAIAAGGSSNIENIVPACQSCNKQKGSTYWQPRPKPTCEAPSSETLEGQKKLEEKRREITAVVKSICTPVAPRPKLLRPKVPGAGLNIMQDALASLLRQSK